MPAIAFALYMCCAGGHVGCFGSQLSRRKSGIKQISEIYCSNVMEDLETEVGVTFECSVDRVCGVRLLWCSTFLEEAGETLVYV